MANLKLIVDSNYYMTASLDESIQQGEDITITWSFDPSIEYYRVQLAFENNKRKKQEYVTWEESFVVKAPFNDYGFLGLQIAFESAESGKRKTNVVWANIHYSIIGEPPKDTLAQLQALAFVSAAADQGTSEIVFYNIAGAEVARVPFEGTDVTEILRRLATLEVEFSELEAGFTSLEQLVSTFDGAITSNTNKVNDHETRITTNTNDISLVKERVSENELAIQTSATNIAANTSAIETNKTNVEALQTSMTAAQSDITSLGERVDTSVTDLQSSIDNVVATTYTKMEVDNIVSGLEFDTSWQEPVQTFDDLVTTYPNPQQGWTVLVLDVGQVFNYNGTEWVQITGGGVMQYAGETTDGIITSVNFREWQAKATTSQVQTVQSNLDVQTERVTANEQNISANAGRIDANETAIQTNATNIGTNASDIVALKGRMSTAETNIQNNTGDIDTAKTNIQTNASNIQTNVSNISTLETNVAGMSDRIDTAESGIETNATDILQNQNDIQALRDFFTVEDITDKIAKAPAATSIAVRKAQRWGNLVNISVVVTFPSAPVSGSTMFTIAEGYRPLDGADTSAMVTYTGGVYSPALASVTLTGAVTIQANTTYIYNLVKLTYLIA